MVKAKLLLFNEDALIDQMWLKTFIMLQKYYILNKGYFFYVAFIIKY